MSAQNSSKLQAIGWACFAPSGALSWRSVETSRDASLAACFGAHWLETWPTLEQAGWRCIEVSIGECSTEQPVPARKARKVNENRLERATIAVAKVFGWEYVPDGDKPIQHSSNPRAKEFVAAARAALEA